MFEPGTDSYMLAVIGLLTLCSCISRAGYFVFGNKIPLTDNVRRALRYAPPAALIAIIVPELLPWAEGARAFVDVRLLAALVAVLVYVRTRSTIAVILSGMGAFWLLRFLLP